MTLWINGCMRENSRTKELAQVVLAALGDEVTEVCLHRACPEGLNPETLALRNELLQQGALEHPMFALAHQFAVADTIVVAAPYWDLLFPAAVRAYFETITVGGITFQYDDHGIPHGLCRAKKLIYVTTAGGPIVHNFGFEYVDALAHGFYGIPQTHCIKAEGLDIFGADVAAIMAQAKATVQELM